MSEIEKKICIIDYGSGNIGSVSNVLNKLNLNYCVSNSIEDFKNSSHFILPGVGSFGSAMKKLNQSIDIDKLEYEIELLQLLQLPESILHWNVELSSLLLNSKVADWLLVGSLGPEEIVIIGSVMSIVQLCDFRLPVLPTSSVAFT